MPAERCAGRAFASPITAEEATAALEAESRLVTELAAGLREADHAGPTRCPPWLVKALLAHIWIGLGRIQPMAANSTSFPVTLGTVAPGPTAYYLRQERREQAANAARIAAAQDAADSFRTGHDLAIALNHRAATAVAIAHATDPKLIVRTRWGDHMRFGDYLVTRVVEVAVHGLDLTDALSRPPVLTAAAADVVTRLLQGLLSAEVASPPSRDPVRFIEEATGRRPLPSADVAALGERAHCFPLIS